MRVETQASPASRLIAALCAPSAQALPVPKTLVIVAHPDDEVIGTGSRLGRLRQARFIHVTDGAPRDGRDAAAHGLASAEAYAGIRRKELLAALGLCGIGPEQACCLDCPDQQVTIHMEAIARDLQRLLLQSEPQVILTHPYEGGHPDHDATALAVHAAVALYRRASDCVPDLVEMSSYHMGPNGICPCEFLHHPDCEAAIVHLTAPERQFKQRLFDCFPTQRETLRYFPTEIECFRVAPAYDFTTPPHPGKLFYECFDWGMSGDRFRKLTVEALAKLGLEGRL
jgi:N-acetylglucosamine malate deacetylase 2